MCRQTVSYVPVLAVDGATDRAVRRRRPKMYSPNRNPTELYYERDALLRLEVRLTYMSYSVANVQKPHT